MLVYTPAELKAIAGQMGKGTITDEVYLVLRNRTMLRKTPCKRKKEAAQNGSYSETSNN